MVWNEISSCEICKESDRFWDVLWDWHFPHQKKNGNSSYPPAWNNLSSMWPTVAKAWMKGQGDAGDIPWPPGNHPRLRSTTQAVIAKFCGSNLKPNSVKEAYHTHTTQFNKGTWQLMGISWKNLLFSKSQAHLLISCVCLSSSNLGPLNPLTCGNWVPPNSDNFRVTSLARTFQVSGQSGARSTYTPPLRYPPQKQGLIKGVLIIGFPQ